ESVQENCLGSTFGNTIKILAKSSLPRGEYYGRTRQSSALTQPTIFYIKKIIAMINCCHCRNRFKGIALRLL
ncbi:MAG: hypothetical protein ACRDAP_15050, partial [Shewanella sp.]